MTAELGQKTVNLSTLVRRTAEESFLSLQELVYKSNSPELSDYDKKISLLKFINDTQQRMLRLIVLARCSPQVPLIQLCQQLGSFLSSHDTCFTQTADLLFFLHEDLQQARAPIYGVPSAIEVLLTGSYGHLPKCVENVAIQSSLDEDQQKSALKKLEVLLRSKLLETSLPKEISELKISDGTAILRVDGEFQVVVTLGYRGHLNLWRILHVELLVGERFGAIKLEESRQFSLGDDLERRMAMSVEQQQNPFVTLYAVLHDFCVALIMDTVIKQLRALRLGRWKNAIKLDLISDATQGRSGSSFHIYQDGEYEASGHRTPGIKIGYWLDSDMNLGDTDIGACPFIKIEPGTNLQIKCIHSTFIVDPVTGKEAELKLDQCSIDVEMLLLKAIRCNSYTRLLEVHKDLTKNDRFCLDASDVNLCCNMDETVVDVKKKDARVAARKFDGQEVLCVRAYGSAFFILGINIRTGHYRLQSSRSAISSTALSDSEDALNQGTISVPEVFANLRTRIILHLLASIGTVLGLKVYENGLSGVEVPENIVTGSNFLLMGFPDFGHSHFLHMQLDKDFKFVFQLLEMQPDHSEKLKTLNIVCCKKIDVNHMLMLEDETNLNVLDVRKVAAHLPKCRIPNDASRLLSVLTPKELMPIYTSLTSFSSRIDEVFELRKGTLPVNHRSSNPVIISSTDRDTSVQMPVIHRKTITDRDRKTSVQMPVIISSTLELSTHYNGSLYSPGNNRGLSQSMPVSSLSVTRGRSGAHKLSVSKCEQTIASLRSPESVEVSFRSPLSVEVSSFGSMDEDQHRFMNESSLDLPTRSSHILSGANLSNILVVGTTGISGSNSLPAPPLCPTTLPEHNKNSRKRKNSDILNLLASSRGNLVDGEVSKRRGLLASKALAYSDISSEDPVVDREVSKRRKLLLGKPLAYSDISSDSTHNSERISVGNLIARANRGNEPSGVYMPVLLHVVRHCSLRIKHAMLTSQLKAMGILYFEETAPRSSFLHIRFKVHFVRGDSWQDICLRLGNPGKLCWDVKITDKYFRDLWKLYKGDNDTPWESGIHIANTSITDSHIRYNSEGIIISYQSVEADSIKKLVGDIHRLHNARMFALGMRKILGVKTESKIEFADSKCKLVVGSKGIVDGPHILSDKKSAFRIEAVGLMSLLFNFDSGVQARFIVEWESGRDGCTVHVTPDPLSRNTKFLEDFINQGEVESLLDCIRLTAGPLHALAAATGPSRASALSRQGTHVSSHGRLSSSISPNLSHAIISTVLSSVTSTVAASAAVAGRRASVAVPSSLPIDIFAVLRGPYWIRILYRKHFAVDMRCYARDQVWLQPARPPKGGPSIGGSLPCPHFRSFIIQHVAQELNGLDRSLVCGQQTIEMPNLSSSIGLCRPGSQVSGLNRAGNSLSVPPAMTAGTRSTIRRPTLEGVPAHVRGELNTAYTGIDDDGGYGGGWVPLVTLEKVLQGVMKYLGVLWLFAQLPDILKEVIGSILKEKEGAVLKLDHKQPVLCFFIRGYVFSVSVHRFQLLLEVTSVKRFHHQQLVQQQQNEATFQEELTPTEISEICTYFRLRVASEPYDASRVASFITLLTLPIAVLREFLKLMSGEKVMSQALGGVAVPIQNTRVELCLENQASLNMDGTSGKFSGTKSNIHYNRPYNRLDFALIVVLDPAHIPQINTAGGASWLPYCVSVRLRYSYGENQNVSFLDMEGSHGGRACWLKVSDWETCKRRVACSVEVPGCLPADISQGRLRLVADNVQRALHLCLQGLRETSSGLPGTV